MKSPIEFTENFIYSYGSHITDDDKSLSYFYNEAVFTKTKGKFAKTEGIIQSLKDKLESDKNNQEISATVDEHKSSGKSFKPLEFWKNTLWKELEDEIKSIFGFRVCAINPYIEKYDDEKKKFESKILNCSVSSSLRFPIEGVITDSGFYDKTHSCDMNIWISLGLLDGLDANEIVAVLLHEFGHSIDPAIVDITYGITNDMSKYLTDRVNKVNNSEKKVMKEIDNDKLTGLALLSQKFNKTSDMKSMFLDLLGKMGVRSNKVLENKIKTKIKGEKDFTRKIYCEAYADNFARMYGYGPILMKSLNKLDKDKNDKISSRYKLETARQKFVLDCILGSLNDVHKTSIHRGKALIKEYESDIENKDTSAETKKQLQKDKEEIEKLLDELINQNDSYTNKVYKIISDEIDAKDNNKE